MNIGKEMVDEGRNIVVFKRAEEMEADGFSKPYDPSKHKPFSKMIMGTKGKCGQQVGVTFRAKRRRKQRENCGQRRVWRGLVLPSLRLEAVNKRRFGWTFG
jgi:hypothetical protein